MDEYYNPNNQGNYNNPDAQQNYYNTNNQADYSNADAQQNYYNTNNQADYTNPNVQQNYYNQNAQQYAQPQQPQYQAPVYQPTNQSNEVMSVGSYIGMFLLSAIPIVNIICWIVWLVSPNTNKNKKNYIIANIVIFAITILLSVIISVLATTVFGTALYGFL